MTSNTPSINKIALEDCLNYLGRLPNGSIDLAVIDPPYNLNKGDWDKFSSQAAFERFTDCWLDAFLPKMKLEGSFYIFNTPFNCAYILKQVINKGATFLNWITWYKKDGFSALKRKYVNNQETILFFSVSESYYFNPDEIREPYQSPERMRHAAKHGILKNGKRWYPNPNGRLCGDVWEFSSDRHKKKKNGRICKQTHPTPKPEDMIERIIRASSKPDDLVLDLFSGTGTTAAMCKKLGRKFLGCESCSDFHAIIQERIKQTEACPC